MHFPEELSIKSFGSGYGGNALLGKKCHALRIASWQARTEGWLAEHMLIVGIENPQGEIHYLACAFPSACGKTNLAMLIPPASYKGWKVWTVGDDIAWLHPGKDGRLYAINPESGYFGVVPGTNAKTNRNAYETIRQRHDFHQCRGDRRQPALVGGAPRGQTRDRLAGTSVRSRQWSRRASELAFHRGCDAKSRYSKLADAPGGVPISAIVFGGRRRTLAPLVYQARSWLHGVLVGAGVASETTAAATGAVGVVRRDPMAMKPFAGYNFADYWAHWIDVGAKLEVAAADFSRQLVPPGRRRQVPVAGIRREPARSALDHRPLQGVGRGARNGRSAICRDARIWTPTGSTSPPAHSRNCSASIAASWRAELERYGGVSRRSSAIGCRRRCTPS